jgi:hypothetical protein
MSRRYTIAIADLNSGAERRVTVSVAAALVMLIVMLSLPVFIGLGVAWKVSSEAQRVQARYRTLDIERANYLAATEALARHIDSGTSSNPAFDQDSFAPTNVVPELGSSAPVQRGPRSPTPAVSPITVASASVAASAKGTGPAVTGDRSASLSTEREQLSEVLNRLSQRRALAEEANAPTLASRLFQEGAALEIEARQLAQTGRISDALPRAQAADARFRAAESEANIQAAARERLRMASAPSTRPPTVEAPRVEPANPGEDESARPLASSAAQAADAESSIRGVIAEYVNGLESRNVAALKRVWPSLGGNQEKALRTEFANARTVKALFHDPRITINDDTTTVTGFRSYGLETQDGQRLFTTTRTTITLRRIDGAWVIEQVVHHP